MITKENVDIDTVCWLAGSYGQDSNMKADNYYLPETLDEMTELCRKLYSQNKHFDLVGHTSNLYFRPNYKTENLISTRRLNKWEDRDDAVQCECGVSVRRLSSAMIRQGVEGFAGLVDLPGTVAAGIYGNAGCFGCSLSDLLKSLTLLKPNGDIEELIPAEMRFRHRSSCLKRREMRGVILSVKLKKVYGDLEQVNLQAQRNHEIRKNTQPGPNNNLGSVFCGCDNLTIKGVVIKAVSAVFANLMHPKVKSEDLYREKTEIACKLMNRKELAKFLPYGFNRYIWNTPEAHRLFDSYVDALGSIYKNPKLEIEIRG